MSFDELYYSISHITDYHGFEFVEKFDWHWRYQNEYSTIDVFFNAKIVNGTFEKNDKSLLQICRMNKNPLNNSPKYYKKLTLIMFEDRLVKIKNDCERLVDEKREQEKYGFCYCGFPFSIRTNHATLQQFLGCSNYPECKNTKPYLPSIHQ